MQEVDVKNDLGLKISVNGMPNLTQMPDDELDLLATILELEISNLAQKSYNRKRYYNNAKQKDLKHDKVRPP